MIFVCGVCSKEFADTPAKKRKYCSHTCFYKASERRQTVSCAYCKTEIIRALNRTKRVENSFCSPVCSHSWDSKNKAKYPQLRDKRWCEQEYKTKSLLKIANSIGCGETTVYKYFKKHGIKLDRKKWLAGVPKSQDHRRTLSEARIKKGLAKGHKNPNWKGGVATLHSRIRSGARFKKWRKEVFDSNEKECVFCGTCDRLEVDHIKQFRFIVADHNIKTVGGAIKCEELWDVSNGRILCRFCNIQREYL